MDMVNPFSLADRTKMAIMNPVIVIFIILYSEIPYSERLRGKF